MSYIEQEILSQPRSWRIVSARLDEYRHALPPAGDRIAVTGCGTSLFMGQAFAALRETKGRGEGDVFPASEFPEGRAYDHVLAISRSGTTTEVERLLERAPATVISASSNSPIVRKARAAVLLDFADEQSIVQTRFATTVLALLRAHLGDDIFGLANEADAALARELPAQACDFDHFVFLGTGWAVGLANEAALKLREAAGAWTESYPAMEYRHGPISVAGERTLLWSFGPLEPELGREISATGATVVNNGADPMTELTIAHKFAVALAGERGLDPDNPRNLKRSVILPAKRNR